MRPTQEGIRLAAYARWEHRGRLHGFDQSDWLAAERQHRFDRNYRVVVADRLDGDAPRAVGSPNFRRCRFCSSAAPRSRFPDLLSIFPDSFGLGSPVAFDQCEDCVSAFSEELDPALLRFVSPFLASERNRSKPTGGIPVAAFKGLVKFALALMPLDDLEEHEDTIEWVGNPDHEFDLSVFRDLSCVVHQTPRDFPASWAALAKKTDEEEAWPSMLFFLGLKRSILQIIVPLSRRDDDLEISPSSHPDVLPPSPFGLGFDPISRFVLPIDSEKRSLGQHRLVA